MGSRVIRRHYANLPSATELFPNLMCHLSPDSTLRAEGVLGAVAETWPGRRMAYGVRVSVTSDAIAPP